MFHTLAQLTADQYPEQAIPPPQLPAVKNRMLPIFFVLDAQITAKSVRIPLKLCWGPNGLYFIHPSKEKAVARGKGRTKGNHVWESGLTPDDPVAEFVRVCQAAGLCAEADAARGQFHLSCWNTQKLII
jgi:hypothetical protein